MYRDTGNVSAEPLSPESDATLLLLVQRGDGAAMASLFDRYSKVVYSVALRVLRDPASAEDVLQEIFMQVWRGFAQPVDRCAAQKAAHGSCG